MAGKNNDETMERFCAFCEKGTVVPSPDGEPLVICKKKGLVSGRYVCGGFRYDPLKRDPKRKETNKEYEIVSIDDN